jgi:hypothetical protein
MAGLQGKCGPTRYLGYESVKAFEKIAAREGIPKHYLSARAPATIVASLMSGS